MSNNHEDAFWAVALAEDGPVHQFMDTGEDPDAGEDHNDEDADERLDRYEIPSAAPDPSPQQQPARAVNRSRTLVVSPLPAHDGVWSPVGADAWYGSALLSVYLTRRQSSIHGVTTPLSQRLAAADDLVALELGCGAVSLPGICLAWRLEQRPGHHRILLSDRDDALLAQQARNVARNATLWKNSATAGTSVDVSVISLDWGVAVDWDELVGPQVDLVFGAELVYTPETAVACGDCVRSLLDRYPTALVCIVQIVDREGWRTIFLPGLRDAGLHVQEEPIDPDCEAHANRMMKRGGSLDRFDFGICYISRAMPG